MVLSIPHWKRFDRECTVLREFNRSIVQGTKKNADVSRKSSDPVSFARGFVEGFGSVGYVFSKTQPLAARKSLAKKLADASASQRRLVITKAKRQILAGYVGKVTAAKMCSVFPASRRVDSMMINADYKKAITELHG